MIENLSFPIKLCHCMFGGAQSSVGNYISTSNKTLLGDAPRVVEGIVIQNFKVKCESRNTKTIIS
jgi:hypothetical protein